MFIGKISITPKGIWNDSESYQYLDMVTFSTTYIVNGQPKEVGPGVFISRYTKGRFTNQPPVLQNGSVNDTYWMQIIDGGNMLGQVVLQAANDTLAGHEVLVFNKSIATPEELESLAQSLINEQQEQLSLCAHDVATMEDVRNEILEQNDER